jgi:predicted nucleic acid-binding protein
MFILDTNVISELRRRQKGDPRVLDWAGRNTPDAYYLSVISVLEIEYGALLIERRDPVQGEMMRRWVSEEIIASFAGRILSINTQISLLAASLHVPNPKPDRDAWIAATALVHNLTVVTRNTRDFQGTGVRLLNPWLA